ncbi:MAG: hypothetical protein PVF58_02245 [Candidatus Methanofastidiosia archaeon]|jgi:hypothetical protein
MLFHLPNKETFIRKEIEDIKGVKMVNYQMLGLGFIVNLIVYTIVLHIAATLAKIEDTTIMKAFIAALIAAIIGLILGLVSIWGGLIALVIAIVIIKYVYDTSWGKAVLTWIIFIVVSIIIGFILGLLGLAVFMSM